jgi:Zn-dependent alcohol dehydrogenase
MRTRAAVLYRMEEPPPYARSRPLRVEELELEGPGPGEVLVEVAHAGLCHSDLSVIDGSRPRPTPMVLGHEASGVVRETGQGVTDVAADDRVVFSFVPACGRCVPCASGRPALCERGAEANNAGSLLGGGRRFRNDDGEVNHLLGVAAFSQYTVAAQESLVKLPPDAPLERAALLGCAVLTGVGAVVNTARVEPGTAVAVFGLGGVGLCAVMGARLTGATPIVAVDLVEGKLQLARELGATATVDAGETADPVEAVRELTGGGAHWAFESVGSEQVLAQAYAATRRGGTTVAVGLPHPSKRLAVPAVTVVAEERTIKGSYMGSAVPRRDIPRLLGLHQAGLLPVDRLVTAVITLEDVNPAFDRLAAGEAVRQLVGFDREHA